eukprot:snap_masked-scaffold_13-processed-gene-9.42-mRNA-1 protein AED:1.00 eAED:1.00 QI:0/0/0/0/1/1/2/0/85
MRAFLGQADKLIYGFDIFRDQYPNKQVYLTLLANTVLMKRDPEHPMYVKNWEPYQATKTDLVKLSLMLASYDYVDPMMQMKTDKI